MLKGDLYLLMKTPSRHCNLGNALNEVLEACARTKLHEFTMIIRKLLYVAFCPGASRVSICQRR